MTQNKNNVLGPYNRILWNNLLLYKAAIQHHKDLNNTKVVEMIEPIYKELKKSIRKVA